MNLRNIIELIIFLTTLLIFLPLYYRFHRKARDLDGFEIIQDVVRNRDENLIIISSDE